MARSMSFYLNIINDHLPSSKSRSRPKETRRVDAIDSERMQIRSQVFYDWWQSPRTVDIQSIEFVG
jgi:hypothetical protein